MRGTQGYEQQAAKLIERYEAIPFPEKHRAVMHLVPPAPSNVLDIGAGSGADASWLAAQGHRVLAVEPTEAFRRYGLANHPSPRIEWLDDGLPRRHGPVPPGRLMYDVDAGETIALAGRSGLEVRLHKHGESKQAQNREAGVTWTSLAFALGSSANRS